MDNILRGLNRAQRAAVTSSASVLQVLAPPGSGKTKTLTSRVAYLLSHNGYAPRNVICCTFTIKASREMRERLRGMIGADLESKLILGTFHSICRRYLVSYGHLIGIPQNFGIADSDDSLNIIKRAIKRLHLSIDAKSARSRISHRKARGKRLDDLKLTQKNADAREFATIFQEYEESLATSNLLDYDDLLLKCVDLLKQHPHCVSNIEALLIDEFQDTNIVQFELMKLLASAQRRITIVGDPDQSIYGFRSAEIENLRRMKAFYPDTVVINLEENYRSASAILKLAQAVIEQDNDRPDKKLKSTHCYGTLPVLRHLPNPHEEALWIVSEIKRMTAMTGNLVTYGDVAILLRSAFLSLLIEKALANAGIPYKMVGGRRFFDRVEVRLLLDYLRCISHPDNTSALLAIINTPARKVGDTTVKEFIKLAQQKSEPLWSVLEKVLDGQIVPEKKLSKPAEQGLKELVTLVKSARSKMEKMSPQETPSKLIELVANNLKYNEFLRKQYPEDFAERLENVQELIVQAQDATFQFNPVEDQFPEIDGVKQEQASGPQEALSRFLANVVLSTEVEAAENGEVKPRITISTIHSAKGLEWPVVFVPAVYEGSIPHSRADDTNEERRLLYVAMTRAQALLYMTFPVMQSRDASESVLSQFLPSKITTLTSGSGPIFSDKVVEDVASVLRRPPPSQEALAQGVLSIKESDSRLDDIWLIDGSYRRSADHQNSQYRPFVLEKGQSLSDALRTTYSSYQKSNYSTMTTTMTGMSSMSTQDMPLAFTTANQHLKTIPQLPEITTRPVPSKQSSDTSTATLAKKPRLSKSSSSGQGSIASFFKSGVSAYEPQEPSSQTKPISYPSLPRSNTEPATTSSSATNTRPEPSIPAELSQHRLNPLSSIVPRPGIMTSTLKRPRAVLNDTNTNIGTTPPTTTTITTTNPTNKQPHKISPHSPTQEQSNINNTNQPLPLKTTLFTPHKTTMSLLHLQNENPSTNNTKSNDMNNNTNTNFHGSLQRLDSNISSSSNTSMNMNMNMNMNTNIHNISGTMNTNMNGRRTLGVRRSMNGWENRRNK